MSKKDDATNQVRKKIYQKPWFWIVVIIIIAIAIVPSPNDDQPSNNDTDTNIQNETPHRLGDEIVGISDKDITNISIAFSDVVRNDITGNWRYSAIADDIDLENYVLSYYNEYFQNDDEIHCVINFTRNTTARLNVIDGMIFLSFFDYVDGEEHDAKKMFTGTPLVDYIIYTDNGDIEKIDIEKAE